MLRQLVVAWKLGILKARKHEMNGQHLAFESGNLDCINLLLGSSVSRNAFSGCPMQLLVKLEDGGANN